MSQISRHTLYNEILRIAVYFHLARFAVSMKSIKPSLKKQYERPVVLGGAMAPPDFGRSSGAAYAYDITIGTPGLSNLPTALYDYVC